MSKSIAIMQPYFFPYIGYFQLINSVGEFILYDNIDFIKKGWVNRNRIIDTRTNNPFFFNVPLEKISSYKKISEMRISTQTSWQRKLLKTIFLTYKRALCFEEIYPLIEEIIFFKTESLSELNKHCIIQISKFLGITTEFYNDDNYFLKLENHLLDLSSFNSQYDLSIYSRKEIRAIEICKHECSGCLINPIGGRSLYNKDKFKDQMIDLYFIKTNKYLYKQYHLNFLQDLSIIDVLMFNSKNDVKKILNEYSLI